MSSCTVVFIAEVDELCRTIYTEVEELCRTICTQIDALYRTIWIPDSRLAFPFEERHPKPFSTRKSTFVDERHSEAISDWSFFITPDPELFSPSTITEALGPKLSLARTFFRVPKFQQFWTILSPLFEIHDFQQYLTCSLPPLKKRTFHHSLCDLLQRYTFK